MPQRARESATGNDLANQVALVDAARAALASGGAERALASVREYQTTYPGGAFRPEVAAIRIEALLKLGRKAEARALAERFPATYGPGLLADRVARMTGMTQP
jgi:outer membrane protein assembly factor BamD (BamD/ComL family)